MLSKQPSNESDDRNKLAPIPSVDQFSSQFYQVESACDLDQAKLLNLYKIIG